jgi:ribosomal protein L6P/L9E
LISTSKFLTLKFDAQTNVLVFNYFYSNNYLKLFLNFFKSIFYQFSKLFFKKLKFKGKGYYIYKNLRNTIALQFGYSHLMYLYSYFVYVKFITKTSILLFGVNKISIEKFSKNLFFIKPINIFTGKGIRFSKQIIYKKAGKISSYR